MNIQTSLRKSKAFTLIELLIVIAIIGLLAALVVGLAGIATRKARISRVQNELAQWETLVESYKAKKGFYPPDNANIPNDPAINPLFYELAGTIFKPAGPSYQTVNGQYTITQPNVKTAFNIDGFVNTSEDRQEVVELYNAKKSNQYLEAGVNGVPVPIVVLGVPVDGPLQLSDPATGKKINPWRYVSSSPTNNPESFDLWMDILVGGKTIRICNWSKSPITL